MKDWIPLITKLVWPTVIIILVVAFRPQIREMYGAILKRIESGGSVGIGGWFVLGEAAAQTKIQQLSAEDLSVAGVGGPEGFAREPESVQKSSYEALQRLRDELRASPAKSVNTLLVTDEIDFYSVRLLKDYIGTLGLRFVVFQEQGTFSGWMHSGPFVAQLPPEEERTVTFESLSLLAGLRTDALLPNESAKTALLKMQEKHLDSLPVVDESGKWLFFVSRGETLARLMTSLLAEEDS